MPPPSSGLKPGRGLIARLPGLFGNARHRLGRTWRRLTWPMPPVNVFHVTHYKAGSQWILRILQELAEPWIIHPKGASRQFLQEPIRPRAIYPTLYVTRKQFEKVSVPADSCRFVVIRDIRDTLISAYFSLKISHDTISPWLTDYRQMLNSVPKDAALLEMTRQWCVTIASIQRTWLKGIDEVIRYEDLLVRDEEILGRVLLDQCRIPASREYLGRVVAANRFESRTGGRRRGAEDVRSHERKGVAGDWRNHFTDKLAREFKDRYGELLVATGYERDDRW